MEPNIAKHILASRDETDLADPSWLVGNPGPAGSKPPNAKEQERLADASRGITADLREALSALGVKSGQPGACDTAKQRLLSLMEASSELCGVGKQGSILRGGDFNGAAPDGAISAQALRDILSPERPAPEGSSWKFVRASDGSLRSSSSKRVAPDGSVAFGVRRVAGAAVDRMDRALDGFDAIWEAARDCSSTEARLGDELGGAQAWSRTEVSAAMERALASRLTPIGPESVEFPPELDKAQVGLKAAARQEARSVTAPAAVRVDSLG